MKNLFYAIFLMGLFACESTEKVTDNKEIETAENSTKME